MSKELTCPNCSTAIPPDRINVQEMVAACPTCAHVFRFASLLSEALPQVPKPAAPLALPTGIEVQRELSTLQLSIAWRAVRSKWFMTIFAILWDLFLIPFIVTAVSGNTEVALFISLHFAVAVGITFYVIALWVNSTKIRVDGSGIDVRHTPIPVPFTPRHFIPAQDIAQFYVEEYVLSRTNGRPDITFALRIKTKNGKDLRLVPGFTDVSGALYLEQEIEKFLKIEDQPI
jgi:hypothetical protein